MHSRPTEIDLTSSCIDFFVEKFAAKIKFFGVSDAKKLDLKFWASIRMPHTVCDINSLEYKIPKMGIPERNETNLYAGNNSILMQMNLEHLKIRIQS